jgi:hypothetical protein
MILIHTLLAFHRCQVSKCHRVMMRVGLNFTEPLRVLANQLTVLTPTPTTFSWVGHPLGPRSPLTHLTQTLSPPPPLPPLPRVNPSSPCLGPQRPPLPVSQAPLSVVCRASRCHGGCFLRAWAPPASCRSWTSWLGAYHPSLHRGLHAATATRHYASTLLPPLAFDGWRPLPQRLRPCPAFALAGSPMEMNEERKVSLLGLADISSTSIGGFSWAPLISDRIFLVSLIYPL